MNEQQKQVIFVWGMFFVILLAAMGTVKIGLVWFT